VAQAQLLRLSMRTGNLLIGVGIISFSVGAAIAQVTIKGLDLDAIDKRVRAEAEDIAPFVSQVLDRQAKAKVEQRATVESLVETASRKVKALKSVPGAPSPTGVDLDMLVSQAGQAMTPEVSSAPMFMAFASLSMPADSLQRMIADVSKTGGMVVFRGFSSAGGRAFIEQLRKVVPQGEAAHISIDPRLFSAYHVTAVPTYVAASSNFTLCSGPDCVNDPPAYDRMAGNVTAHFALETFADGKGPGAPVAAKALAHLDGGQ
jgi:conjugal transfer pilus assembly protein TrbC